MALAGFEESIGGKWVLTKNEGFEEYLAAMGIGYIKRKLAGKFTTTMEMIKIGDKKIRIITKGPKDMDTQIDVDEEVEEVDPFDNKIKGDVLIIASGETVHGPVKVTWDTGSRIMRTEANPIAGSDAKRSIVERKIVEDGQMLMEVTLPNDNIICKRYFKKESS